MNGPKLLVTPRKAAAQFTMDPSGTTPFLGNSDTTGVVLKDGRLSLFALLGILNSAPILSYMQAAAPESALGIVFSPGRIERLPLPPLTEANADTLKRIGALAEALLQTPESEISERQTKEAEIDQLVRRLYQAH